MKIKLNVEERFAVINNLPALGNYANMRVVQKTRRDLEFTKEEKDHYGFVEDIATGKMQWDPTIGKEEKEFEIDDTAAMLLRSALIKLNDESKIAPYIVTTYEKFVENKPTEGGEK